MTGERITDKTKIVKYLTQLPDGAMVRCTAKRYSHSHPETTKMEVKRWRGKIYVRLGLDYVSAGSLIAVYQESNK